jgi:hypothetical protein
VALSAGLIDHPIALLFIGHPTRVGGGAVSGGLVHRLSTPPIKV